MMPQGKQITKSEVIGKKPGKLPMKRILRSKAVKDDESPMTTVNKSKVKRHISVANADSGSITKAKKQEVIVENLDNFPKVGNEVCDSQTFNNNAKICNEQNVSIVFDGIDVETEVDEELDYVDDAIDQGDISDNETVAETTADDKAKDAEQQLLINPALRMLSNQLLDERIKQAEKSGKSSGSNLLTTLMPQKRVGAGITNQMNIKSPSDTTIYAPERAEQEQEESRQVSEVVIPGHDEAKE